jgi:hypothetical protein
MAPVAAATPPDRTTAAKTRFIAVKIPEVQRLPHASAKVARIDWFRSLSNPSRERFKRLGRDAFSRRSAAAMR